MRNTSLKIKITTKKLLVGKLITLSFFFLTFGGDKFIFEDLLETTSCCLNNLCLDHLLEAKSQPPVVQ